MTNTNHHFQNFANSDSIGVIRQPTNGWGRTAYPRHLLPTRGQEFPECSHLPMLSAATTEAQNNIQAPGPLIFTSALAAISIAQQALIDVKKPSGQIVPSSFMLMIIGSSGERKSTTDNVFTKEIRDFERRQKEEHRNKLQKWSVKHEIWETQKKSY